jgi:hypothetical protein
MSHSCYGSFCELSAVCVASEELTTAACVLLTLWLNHCSLYIYCLLQLALCFAADCCWRTLPQCAVSKLIVLLHTSNTIDLSSVCMLNVLLNRVYSAAVVVGDAKGPMIIAEGI